MDTCRRASTPLPALLGLIVGTALLLLSGGHALAKGPRPGDPGVPDKALQKAIDAAIAKGAVYLRSTQSPDGSIGSVTHGENEHYQIGVTSLSGLALLAAGDRRGTDPEKPNVVDKAIAFCRKQDGLRAGAGSRTTYGTGTLLMFVTAYYHDGAKGKKPKKRSRYKKEEKGGGPCNLPEDVRKWVRDMAMWMINVQMEAGGWGYPRTREDMSNTQYALLGLRAARDCGAKVPGRVFIKVITRLLALQEPDGPKVLRTLGGEKKGETTYKISSGDRARGWSYLERPFQASGSMTTAAIACLAICNDALTVPKRLPAYAPKREREVQRAVQDGFSWLDIYFSVTKNPGKGAPNWHYYYLYGLERAAVLAGRVLVGDHDWYIEGARYLIAKQNADGRWSTGTLGGREYKASDIVDTAWAILFLKRATKPMKPIPGPVITDSSPSGK